MKITGSAVLHADPQRVWAAINDPAVLAGVIPGCDRFTALGEGHYAMTVTLGVAAIKGSYAGEVRLSDLDAPHSLTMRANGAGGPGTIDTTVAVRLTDNGDGSTTIDYDADAIVGGMVGGVGQRVLGGVAKKTAGLFFAAIDDVLTGRKPAGKPATAISTPGGEASQAIGQADSPKPAGAAGPATVPSGRIPLAASAPGLPMLGAALFGAVSMAVGVLIGARVGRRR